MNRKFYFLSAIALVTLAMVAPVSVQAQTMSFSAPDLNRLRLQHGTAIARNGTLGTINQYVLEVPANNGVTLTYFSSLVAARAAASGKQHAAVLDAITGSLVYSADVNLYTIQVTAVPGATSKPPVQTSFPTLDQAISAASGTPDVLIRDTITGAVVWSNMNNFVVVTAGQSVPYETYSAALLAASTAKNATIESVLSGTTVWSTNYQVWENGAFVNSFNTLSDAQLFAGNSPNTQIVQTSSGQDVYNNAPQYNVFQNGTLLKQFTDQQSAITYAQSLTNSSVVDIATQAVVYSNVAQFLVEIGSKTIQSFADENTAIAFAKTQSGAVVVQISNNQVVWSATGNYDVYRYLQLVRSFSNQADAVAYAKTLDHAQVIQSATGTVEYSNYPTTVKSPYGDTFTVVNGLVVDHWGATITSLAPAPSFMQAGSTYVSNDYDHWYQVLPTGDVYVGAWENPYQTLNLETQSTITASQINAFLAVHAVATSVLQKTGQYFIEAQNAYGVNAQYLVAHAIIESGWGTSDFAVNRDNLFGYEAYTSDPNAAASFRSIEYDINFQAWFVRNDYLNATGSFFNGSNLNGMNVDYATDPYWSNSIARVMSEIATYSPTLAAQPPLGEQAVRKVFPYPTGAQGLATSNLTIYNAPLDSTTTAAYAIGHIAHNTTFSVYGDCPGWDEVKLANQTVGFVNWNGVSLKNMVDVVSLSSGDMLNIRSAPTVSASNIIDQVSNGTYLVLIQTNSGGWDLVMDGNGKQGWVSKQYVQIIH